MSQFKFKTNISCGNCLSKVTPLMNALSGIESWNVDLTDPDRTMTVETSSVTPEEIVATVKKAGYSADKV